MLSAQNHAISAHVRVMVSQEREAFERPSQWDASEFLRNFILAKTRILGGFS